jgi:hypothetical protein
VVLTNPFSRFLPLPFPSKQKAKQEKEKNTKRYYCALEIYNLLSLQKSLFVQQLIQAGISLARFR